MIYLDYSATTPVDKRVLETFNKVCLNYPGNSNSLHKLGIELSPPKMNFFRLAPVSILSMGLSFVFRSKFGNMFMYQHSMKAPDEMRQLHEQFYRYIKSSLA